MQCQSTQRERLGNRSHNTGMFVMHRAARNAPLLTGNVGTVFLFFFFFFFPHLTHNAGPIQKPDSL